MQREILTTRKQQRRARRTRSRIHGTSSRPRLSVFRSHQHIAAQLIDDDRGVTLGATHDTDSHGTKTERARMVGTNIAKVAKQQGITVVTFDRGAYRYHGRVKALAEAARAEGLNF